MSAQDINELVARIFCDLGKNIVTVGFASYFFKDLPLPFRISFVILGVALIIFSVMLYRKGGQ